MKKASCVFLFLLIALSVLGFKYEDRHVFSIDTYYPLSNNSGLGSIELEIEMGIDNDFKLTLEEIFKNPPRQGLVPIFSKDTQINSMAFDPKTMILNIDISREFIEYNMGSSLEYERLRGIVNTVGKFYNIDKISISIEGAPYESGHFILRSGESFNVNFENIIKIN